MSNSAGIKRTLALLHSAGETEFTVPLSCLLPGEVKEFTGPEVTVLEARAAALKGEIFTQIALLLETYFLDGSTGLTGKKTNVINVARLLPDEKIRPGNTVEVNVEATVDRNWLPREETNQDRQTTMLAGNAKIALKYSAYAEEELTFLRPAAAEEAAAEAEAIKIETILTHFKELFDLSLPLESGEVLPKAEKFSGCLVNQRAAVLHDWVKVEGDLVVTAEKENGTAAGDSYVFPVKYFVEVKGAREGMDACVTGQVPFFVLEEQDEKQHLLRGLLRLEGRLTGEETLQVAAERGTGSLYHSPHDHFQIEEIVSSGSSQLLIERQIFFRRPVRAIREPVDARVRNLRHEVINNKVIVRGVLHKQLFAVDAHSGTVFLHEVDESFVHFVDVPGARPGMRAQANAHVEFVKVDISPDKESARQVAIVAFRVRVKRLVKKEKIFKPPHHPHPSPKKEIIYSVRSGDTIWKISRMFGVPMEAIIAANNLKNPDLIFPGQKLIIPK